MSAEYNCQNCGSQSVSPLDHPCSECIYKARVEGENGGKPCNWTQQEKSKKPALGANQQAGGDQQQELNLRHHGQLSKR